MNQITVKVDLYDYKQVEKVCRLASEKLGMRSDQLEVDLYKLTELLEKRRSEILEGVVKDEKKKVVISQSDVGSCTKFLSKPNLLNRLNELVGRSGIVGEQNNRLLLFVVASAYKMPDTLHVLIQGSSGSGKTRLMRTISELMPPEDVSRYTRVTDSALYNQPEDFYIHRLVCFEDLDGLKEDAGLAARELMSNEELRSAVSMKDQHGRITGGEKIVKGPIGSLACTTKGSIYEDNISRCFVIAVDESKEQTLRVIDFQNRMAAGMIDKSEQLKIRDFVRNCIRLLKPYEVLNQYSMKVKLPEEAHKIRRLNELYQHFVKQVTLLNQYQRKKDKLGRLITEKADLEQACEILFESIVLKVDELDGSLRQFFERLKEYVKSKGEKYEFGRREIRLYFRMSKTQIQRYMTDLQELEYIKQEGHANRGYRYKISYWDDNAGLRTRLKNDLAIQLKGL